MTPEAARSRLRRLSATRQLRLPLPGAGSTARRWMALFKLARDEDVSVARLAEAHVDAEAILREADLEPFEGALYGVWASVGPDGRDVAVDEDATTVSGCKPFCSGLGIVDRALIDVHVRGGSRRLVDVEVGASSTVHHRVTWGTAALAATSTGEVEFRSHHVGRFVGPTDWYLDRIGFWYGACGPSACWAGAAAGIVASSRPGHDVHRLARHGAMIAEIEGLEALLLRAGDRVDTIRTVRAARHNALCTRYAVHEACHRVLDQFARANGPRALVDHDVAQRYADTLLYLRQFHADHDLVALARTELESDR